MIKSIILLGALMISSLAYSQVGINNESPQGTLDVTAKTTDGTKPEGIIAPRLTGDQIKSGDLQYDTPQIGTIIYATSAVGTSTPKTINITSPGYYYFDNNLVWQKFTGSAAGTDDWHTTGNSGTNGGTIITVPAAVSTNYVGTADSQNFVVGVNGVSRGIFTQQGSFIGGAGATDLGALPAHAFGATPPTGSFIWGGGHQLAVSAGNASYAAVFGNRNIVNSSNGFTTGTQNSIGTSSVSSMVSGNQNNLGNFFQTSLVTGRLNTMNYTAVGGNGNIIAGQSNSLSGGAAPTGIIVGGSSNTSTTSISNAAIFGNVNTVNAGNTLVAGGDNTITPMGAYGITLGYKNTVSNQAAFAAGYQNTIAGLYGFAGGYQNSISANNSVAFGRINTVNGESSFVGGELNTTAEYGNVALGFQNNIGTAQYGTAIGRGNTLGNGHHYSMALGYNATTTDQRQLVLGFENGVVLPKSTVAPTPTTEGQLYYNTTDHITYVWNGTMWKALY